MRGTALWTLAGLACGAKVVTPAPGGTVAEKPVLMVAAAGAAGPMHARLAALTEGRDLVILGDLDGVRASMQTLADGELPGSAPSSWRPFLEDLREASARAAFATDLPSAAGGVAEAAASCGECHRGQGVEVVFYDRPRPAAGMGLHAWAADQLWEGLVGDDPGRWGAGVDALSDQNDKLPEAIQALPMDRMAAASTLHQRVHALADGAREAKDPRSRAEVVGGLLRACAECHTLARGRGP